jgi:N-acetylglucosaminyl-diphospho-decaprenol L-rhamnosyltransferase
VTPSLQVIIVNFRTPELTIGCLESLASEVATVPGTRVWVVENGSGDDSAERIGRAIGDRQWGSWATLLPLTRNHGFAGGNNRGLEAAGFADFTLLLNSDTVVHAGCLHRCLEVMKADPGIGAMTCKLLNADGTIQNVTRRFPNPARVAAMSLGLDHYFPRLFGWSNIEDAAWDRAAAARDVDWIGGAFLLIRGEVLQRIGPLDERFFFYGEDIEFCHRVWRAGSRCRYDPSASTTHLGGGSSDPERLSAQARSAHTWRARYLNQRLCYGRLAAAWVRGVDIVGLGARLAWARVSGRSAEQRARDWAASLQLITGRLTTDPRATA